MHTVMIGLGAELGFRRQVARQILDGLGLRLESGGPTMKIELCLGQARLGG